MISVGPWQTVVLGVSFALAPHTTGGNREVSGVRVLLAASPKPGELMRVHLDSGTGVVDQIQIDVKGYVQEIESVNGCVVVLLLDVSVADSRRNGLYRIENAEGKSTLLLEGHEEGKRIRAITANQDDVFVLTEDSILRTPDCGLTFQEVATVSPSYQCRSFAWYRSALAYTSSDNRLVLLDEHSGGASNITPFEEDQGSICPFSIVGSSNGCLVLSRFASEYVAFGGPHCSQDMAVLEHVKSNRLEGLKEIGGATVGWRNVEYPAPSVVLVEVESGAEVIVHDVNVLDLIEAPVAFAGPADSDGPPAD